MFQQLIGRYFGENVSNERRVFNIIHVISVIGIAFSTILVYIYIPGVVPFYITIGTVVLGMLTFFEGNRTGNLRIPVFIMSLIFNFVFFTTIYLGYGRLVCVIPIYFIFGLLYSVLMIDDKWGLILVSLQTVFYLGLIVYASSIQINPLIEGQESVMDYSGVFVAILVAGVFGGLAVRSRIRMQEQERERADRMHEKIMEDYLSKDVFLINMSHEIRTPMNAIVGTVNLLLDQNVSDRVKDSVYNILNSCNALLSITNELMDISKADSEHIPINNTRYDFGDLLLEIINMIAVRLMNTGVNLYVEIAEDVPRFMYGDVSKLRQLFINILNNAVKYTKAGRIRLRISCKDRIGDTLTLCVDVEDTGIGIKEENMSKLFSAYERFQEGDAETRNIEGTGLGLPICKEILDKLGGDIRVKSEYRVGSTFSFFLPQRAEGETLLGQHDYGSVHVLLYERDPESAEYLKQVLRGLKVHYVCPENEDDFDQKLISRKFTHLFIAYERYMEKIRFLDTMIRDEKLVLITEISQTVFMNKYGCILTRPAHALNISAALLNESNNYVHEIIKKGGFSCPDATILVVDDNMTNLTVAKGLLKKYDATILTALSGKECLNLLETNRVDLVFLDYMMPEMNGIDTLQKIREMDDAAMQTLPVIALTANVVNGAKEMFLNAGFDDYIAKPVEVDRIERALKNFLPRDLIVVKNI